MVTQQIPFGGTVQASLGYDYSKNNQLFQNYNPYYQGTLNFVLTQPLLKNFGWTVSRREIIVAQNSFESSRSQFRDILINTIYSVEEAYWNLVYSIENLKTQGQALESGRDLLTKTKREVEVGTKAPIEVLNAEATVARREADILQSEALVKRSQDVLRTLLNLDVDPSTAGQALVPADKPEFKPYAITLEEAYVQAVARRPDLDTAKTTIVAKQIDFRIAKNQRLPQLDLQLAKNSPGISGQQFIYDPNDPFAPPALGPSGSARAAFRDAFKFLYNNWTAGVTLTIPFGDVIGKAGYAYAKLDVEQAQARLKTQEQQVFLEVSDAVRTPRDGGQERRRLPGRPRAGRKAARGRDEEAERRHVDELLRPDLPERLGQRPVGRDQVPRRIQHRRRQHRQGDRHDPGAPQRLDG